MTKPAERNCIDVIRPYIDAVTKEGMPPVHLLGGVGSVALRNEATIIRTDEKRVTAPADLTLSNFREDGNLRDIETLVLSSNPEHAAHVEECAQATIGGQLVIETFEFRDLARRQELLAHPFGKKALLSFVSDRYILLGQAWSIEDSQPPQRMLFPFSVPIDPEALETWTLEIGEVMEIPIPSPGAVIINYLTRSISGLRGKDVTKVEKMADAIFRKAPETVDWIVDGPGKTQFDLAEVFHTLREPKKEPEALMVGDKLLVAALRRSLAEHEAFMLREADPKTQQKILKLAKFKSRGLHIAESMDAIVTPFQRYIEPRISSILHNK